LIYKLESIAKNVDELLSLVYDYWEEADERRSIDSFNLDVETYLRLEESSIAFLLTARDTEGAMTGFILYTLAPCIHTGVAKASVEVFFVVKAYRTGEVAAYLLSELEANTPDEAYLFFTLKTEFPHDHLIEVTGFRHVENLFMKRKSNGSSNSRSLPPGSSGGSTS